MVFEVLRQIFSAVQSFLELGVGYVSGYYNGSVEAETGRYRILGEYLQDLRDRLVEVNLNCIAFSCLAEFFRNEPARVVVQLFDPDTVLIDLCLDVTVGRT